MDEKLEKVDTVNEADAENAPVQETPTEEMPVEEVPAEQAPEEVPAAETPEEAPAYIPRPAWQVWLARVCLVLFIALILMYYINIMRGGK